MTVRRLFTALFRFSLRVFYKRIELVGLERVPDGPVIFAVNHPNSLIDPLFVLCFARRPVTFLAKAPLFHYPVIGWLARAFKGIPVYRKQDETPGSNLETFERAREVLRGGGSIAIFPEGTTHSDPQLRQLKTGVARIALGAQLDDLVIVPTGIYYTAKQVFRSEAMAVYGEAIRITTMEVRELTAAVDAGLDAVTLQADSHAAFELIARAEDIFTADERQSLAEEFELRRRFTEGYHYLRAHDPARLERLASAIAQLAAELRRAKLEPHELQPHVEVARVVRVVVLLPLAAIGAILNYIPYRLIGFLAKRIAKGEDELIATIKFLSAFVLFPLTWIAYAFITPWALIVVPILAYIALRISEDLDDVVGDLRALVRPRDALVRQRELIREEILAVAGELTAPRS
jgi:1-acyl-sn-glycerol-3-phosphate acyltransferase